MASITRENEAQGNGVYFLFNKESFTSVFGSFSSDSTVQVKQCRAGTAQWEGLVKYWGERAWRASPYIAHGRRNSGHGQGQWAIGDLLVSPSSICPPYGPTSPHTTNTTHKSCSYGLINEYSSLLFSSLRFSSLLFSAQL